MIRSFKDLIEKVQNGEPQTLSVAVAQDADVLLSVWHAYQNRIIKGAYLVGNENEIREIAGNLDIDLSKFVIVNVVEKEDACAAAIRQNEPGLELTEQQQSFLSRSPKSEINVSVFLNGQCVGSAHRNQLTKRIVLAPDAACEGFVACRPEGVLRVVLHVLNVLNDDTHYTVCVKEAAQ